MGKGHKKRTKKIGLKECVSTKSYCGGEMTLMYS